MAAIAAVAAIGLTACVGVEAHVRTPAATVHLGDHWYRPAELSVPRDSIVTVVNDGAVAHTWIVRGPGRGPAIVRPGQTVEVDLRDITSGTYSVYCDQPGHTQAGQVGQLTITP